MSAANAPAAPARPAATARHGSASPRPPLGELLPRGARAAVVLPVAAALAVAGFLHFGASGQAFVGLVFCPALVVLSAIDLEHRLLPNRIVLPTAIVVAAIVGLAEPGQLLAHVAAGVALGGLFFAVGLLFPGSIGMGDAKLGLLLGVALGGKTFVAVEAALLGVLVVAVWMMATQGMSARKKTIAFGPLLALGGLLGFFLA